MKHPLATRALLALGGLAVGLLMVEVIARIVPAAGHADLLFDSPDASPVGLYVIDPELVLVPKPGFEDTIRSRGYTVDLAFNELGLRSPPLDQLPEGPRWLAVGDSFTASVQVPLEDTFGARLGQSLGEVVLNAGVDGYSTWQASGRAARLDPTVNAHATLLTFFLGNDLQDNANFEHVKRTVQGREAGSPIPRAPVHMGRRLLMRYSAIYGHLRIWQRARDLQSGRDPSREWWRDELAIFSSQGEPALRRLMRPTQQALRVARDAAGRRGDRLVVALAPPAFVVYPDRLGATFAVVGLDPASATPDAPAQAVTTTLHQLGIQACDLTPALRAAAAGDDALYFTYDGHWTAAGHRVVAEALALCVALESP